MNVCGNCSSVETVLPPRASVSVCQKSIITGPDRSKNNRSRLCADCKNLVEVEPKDGSNFKYGSRKSSIADSRGNSTECQIIDNKENVVEKISTLNFEYDLGDEECARLTNSNSLSRSPRRSALKDKNDNNDICCINFNCFYFTKN